jgi:transcriptional regulator with XRE-family HTH domain
VKRGMLFLKERFDMKKSIKKQTPFGVFLKELREKKGVSLLDVENDLKIPNAYISQLETGARKKLPEPDRLKKMANYYNVTVEELLEKAGYINSNAIEETLEQKIEKEFLHAINDPQFNKGIPSIPKNLSIDIKKFIIQLYNNSINALYKEVLKTSHLHIPYPEVMTTPLKKIVIEGHDEFEKKYAREHKK